MAPSGRRRAHWWLVAGLVLAGCPGNPSGLREGPARNHPVMAARPTAKPTPRPLPRDDVNPFDPPPDPNQPVASKQRSARTICFRVLKFELPRGAASRSQNLWHHVREDVVGAEKMVLLRENGFRMGVGRRESEAPLKAILENTPGLIRYTPYTAMFMPDVAPIELHLNLGIEDLTVIYFDASGRAVGHSFPECSLILNVLNVIDPQFTDQVTVEVVPELRQQAARKVWRQTPHGWKRVRIYRGKFVTDLAVRVRLARDEFLMIGASEKAHGASSLIGRQFMMHDRDGKPTEYLVILSPFVQQVTAQAR